MPAREPGDTDGSRGDSAGNQPTASPHCGRRTVLKSLGGAVGGGVVVGAGITPATAGKASDCDSDSTPSAVWTADHFELFPFFGLRLSDGNSTTNYDMVGDPLPDSPEEIVVHCHGWRSDADCGKARINTTKDAYAVEGYDGVVTGLIWNSAYSSWGTAKTIADNTAPKLARFLTEYKAANPGTTIRLQGHSLGARVVAETVLELDESGRDDVVTSLIFLGGAIDNTSVAMGSGGFWGPSPGRYGPAIENAVQHAENFWMDRDSDLRWYRIREFSSAIGNDGCDGTPPENYTDHHYQLDDHSDYYKPMVGVIDRVIDTFQAEQ